MNQRQSKDFVCLLQIKILLSKQDSGKFFWCLRGQLPAEIHYNKMIKGLWYLSLKKIVNLQNMTFCYGVLCEIADVWHNCKITIIKYSNILKRQKSIFFKCSVWLFWYFPLFYVFYFFSLRVLWSTLHFILQAVFTVFIY